ncbi:TonB-dependent receptor [Methylococcus sp. EFPC2]|uniref:TonB-dependent receptor domain-containing protein n=1 Tax=Methylococcus sp. EFPC2 TaxID=2812648 RepID=UPI0019671FF6|nr:TonB-dependent receptor [Methylococcus sp. EFPC2]QSA96002.1 TonB-dependent receptor [Methylococcus sp. EFPC2]
MSPVRIARHAAAYPTKRWTVVAIGAALSMPAYAARAADAPPAPPAQAERTLSFAIPAKPLDEAINDFIAVTDWQVGFPSSLTRGIRSPGVTGRYPPAQALEKLLAGSGLTYRAAGPNTVTLQKAPPAPAPPGKPAAPVKAESGQTTLNKVTVTAARSEDEGTGSLTTPSLAESQAKLDKVPGGTTLIDGERIKEGASFTVNDAFAYAPGVYVGDSSGSVAGGSRISIRGSDINSFISPIRGIKFLRDGLPFTNANGFTDVETLNLYSVKQIEVYRGASALEYGASNLGGAVNFVSPTGYTADKLRIGTTLGTNGYVNSTFSSGAVLGGGWDAYGSLSYVTFNGNRQSNEQELFYGYGNIGYRWNEQNETRLHIDIQDIDYQAWAGGLTKQQLKQDPHQNETTSRPRNGWPLYKFDLRHTVRLDDGDQFDFGAYYFNKDFSFTDAAWGFYRDLWQDAGFSWRHQINTRLFGLQNRVVWGGLTQWMWINDHENDPVNGSRGPLRFNERDDWNNVEAYLEDQLSLTDDFNLVLGGQVTYRKVAYQHRFPELAPGERTQAGQDFFNFNPKLGFTWQATKAAQIYGNLSRSAETPPLSDLSSVFQQPRLTSQTGTTVEIGTRGQSEWLKWDLAFYHAWLNNELLIISSPFNPTVFSTTNAGNTQHTGIELGLESTLPLGLIAEDDQIRLRGSYTWSRFQFDSDPVLKDNRLPGIPEHNARFEALYQHPSGFYAGPNVQAVGSNWVDFTNTLAAKPYALFGARVGWDDGRHWKVFVDGRNLTNERYAASVWVMGDARHQDQAQFNPGATRMVFGGFEYRY